MLEENKQPGFVDRLRDTFFGSGKEQLNAEVKELRETVKDLQAQAAYEYGGNGRYMFSVSFNGEKNEGELGPALNYTLDYDMLRLRSHQAYIENPVFKTIIDRVGTWVIGKGLKLNTQPITTVLKSEGVAVDEKKFNDEMEARFEVWAKSKNSSHNRMDSLFSLSKLAFRNGKIGGDVLVILRYENDNVTVQLVDGVHVRYLSQGNDNWAQRLANGNYIRNGIEMKLNGEHVTYWVNTLNPATGMYDASHFEPVAARSASTGLVTAFMYYGSKNRLDNYRGMPLLGTVLENLKIVDRYTTATLGKAENAAKVVYSVEHKVYSDGENPMMKQVARAMRPDNTHGENPVTIEGKQLAKEVQATTNNQTFNLPIGASLEMLDKDDNQAIFKEFFAAHTEMFCAAAGIPPNVAFSIYNDSFSASRAATKDFEHTINVERADFAEQFLQPIYDFWMHVQILQGKIDAPGYLKAFVKDNQMVLGAYRNARFTGPMFPHIDPLKEAMAERLMLGDSGANIPLTTAQASTEKLNNGDFSHNVAQYSEELKLSDNLGMKIVIQPKQFAPDKNNGKNGEGDKAEK